MKFRKKPVVIDAIQASYAMHYAANDWQSLPDWLRSSYDHGNILFAADHISIHTLEGDMRADPADWVIRGIKGELYPCKPDIFEATYEPAE